jgi:hypothetical protein
VQVAVFIGVYSSSYKNSPTVQVEEGAQILGLPAAAFTPFGAAKAATINIINK